MERINLIYLDENGNLYEDPELLALGMNGLQVEIADASWIDFPAGAELLSMPGRLPVGFNEANDQVEVVESENGVAFTAVAAVIPMGFTRCLLPGYEKDAGTELPLFGYTAVGSEKGRLKVAAVKTDEELKWNPSYYNTADLPRLIEQTRAAFPQNRIVRQLAGCALNYHCLTAQNIFYRRWEAGIPVSPCCNADCLGCISRQPAECCPSPQARIDFTPTQREIVELAVAHLGEAPEAIVSFGQGCEGEPSLQYPLLAASIREIRKQTNAGTLNINSNAGNFPAIRELVDAGLDSIRVSLFSAIPDHYRWYHRPRDYHPDDVVKSLKYAVERELMVALNLLFYPGFTNRKAETDALYSLIAETGLKQVQLRNLNLDPEKMNHRLNHEEKDPVAVAEWIASLKARFPGLRVGNYSIPLR
jgi:pyruvate-formate lyase-activating enzyme